MTSAAIGRPKHSGRYPEIWGGVECTVNRVQDQYRDQLVRSGHPLRLDDIDRFADLGIRTLRFPLLWERMQPERDTEIDWTWADAALQRLRERGVRPILGLLHHGHGPRWSGVLHDEFAAHLAEYAEQVAARYPWVDAYTPVNEPLTTARFSGLYGHWYPHARDAHVFTRLLLAQCRATAHAMRTIRRVTPNAQLIQTEDLGKVTGTHRLAYQCDFENERRWLTWDLLTGSVDPSHPMWTYLCSLGISEHLLWEFVESPCAPDVIGVNHYVTSERFLDDRIDQYDAAHAGGNGRHRYADVATVRAAEGDRAGIGALLDETWTRYAKPVAITECHIGCTREEQLRWLHETWRAARDASDRGVDVRAVTSWALLGLYDWDSLVTRDQGHYESGAFDLRAPFPRETAVATIVRALATCGEYTHPLLRVDGWWCGTVRSYADADHLPPGYGVLITGATGTLGQAFARICESRGIPYRLLSRATLDITDAAEVTRALEQYQPWAVINTAGYVKVDAAEHDRDRCWQENVVGAEVLALACRRHGIPLVTYSSDLIFDGQKGAAYVESDAPCPINWYGESKMAAESRVLAATPDALVIRTSAFFGPWDSYNVVTQALQTLRGGDPFHVPADIVVTPTYVPDLVHATLDLLIDGERGVWHLTNQTPVTWEELVQRAAAAADISSASLIVRSVSELELSAPRPPRTPLVSERGWILPSLDDALRRYALAMSSTNDAWAPLADIETQLSTA